jgi:DNA polymerase (family 10)
MNDKLMKKHYSSHLLNSFRILSAAEINIMKDGSLDIANNVLDRLDIV